jgi:hypothetical protein
MLHRELTAVTAERDRLWAAIEDALRFAEAEPQTPHDVSLMRRLRLALATTHPRPCSICRREDCTTEHACE